MQVKSHWIFYFGLMILSIAAAFFASAVTGNKWVFSFVMTFVFALYNGALAALTHPEVRK